MYYFREEYKPWEPLNAKTLRGAKRAATNRAAFIGTRIQISVGRPGELVVVAARKGAGNWQNF